MPEGRWNQRFDPLACSRRHFLARISLGLGTAVLGLTDSAARARAATKHPRVLHNHRQVEEIKQKIEQHDWAQKLFDRIKAEVDGGLDIRYCIRESALLYALTGERRYADKARDWLSTWHLAMLKEDKNYVWDRGATAAITYDLIYDALTEDDRAGLEIAFRDGGRLGIKFADSRRQTWNMKLVEHWNVGLLGFVTGDQTLIDYALRDPGGGLTSGTVYARDTPKRYGGWHQVIEANVKDGLWHEPPTYCAFYVLQGLLALAEAAYNHDGSDLYRWSSPHEDTLKGMMDSLVALTFPIETTGVPGGSFRLANYGDAGTAADGDLYLVNPPWRYPDPASWRDSWSTHSVQAEMEVLYRRVQDPAYAWFLSRNPHRDAYHGVLGYTGLTHGLPIDAGKVAPPPAPSRVFHRSGLAMLRADESPGYWLGKGPACLFVMGENEHRSHAHADNYQIILHAQGRLLYPDVNVIQYEDDKEIGWTRRSIAHNTLVVDGGNTSPHPFTCRHDFSPEVKFVAAAGAPYQEDPAKAPAWRRYGVAPVGPQHWPKNVEVSRALFLTREYLADFFQANGSEEHVYDWALHGYGRLLIDEQRFQSSDDLAPYRWIKDVSKRMTGDSWSVEWVQRPAGVPKESDASLHTADWFRDEVGVRLWMLGSPGTTVYAGEGPLYDSDLRGQMTRRPPVAESRLPVIVARRQTADTVFAALHEPFAFAAGTKAAKPNRIKAYERIGQEHDAIAVRVVGPDYVDYVLVGFPQPGAAGRTPFTLRGSAGETFVFHNFGYIRLRGGKALARGDFLSFEVPASRIPPEGGLLINGRTAVYTRRRGRLTYLREN